MAIFTHGVNKTSLLRKSPLLFLYLKLSTLRNDRSINVSLSDRLHVVVFAGKYDHRRFQNKERINALFVMI